MMSMILPLNHEASKTFTTSASEAASVAYSSAPIFLANFSVMGAPATIVLTYFFNPTPSIA
jgi:hypothetical protein